MNFFFFFTFLLINSQPQVYTGDVVVAVVAISVHTNTQLNNILLHRESSFEWKR